MGLRIKTELNVQMWLKPDICVLVEKGSWQKDGAIREDGALCGDEVEGREEPWIKEMLLMERLLYIHGTQQLFVFFPQSGKYQDFQNYTDLPSI